MSKKLEERLAGPTPEQSPPPVDAWFDNHPEALELMVIWRGMREKGTTSWGVRHITRVLREEYGFPYTFHGLQSYLGRHR
jgi:hypothetical protein